MHNLIWSERFRPKELKDIVLPKKTKMAFKEFIKAGQIANVLLYGPPGSGKTTLGMILLKEIAARKLTLNASSEDRGIATIKQKVKQFARTKRIGKKLNIILLDEADGLTGDAQDALKNTIDTYHKNCRFILTCNQIDKVIDPIISRCILFEFDTLPAKKVIAFCEKILKTEKIKYSIKSIEKIIKVHYPDIRTIINSLQLFSIGGTLDTSNITLDLKQFGKYLLKGEITKLRHLWKNKTDFIFLFKYLFNDFLNTMPKEIRTDAAIVVAEYLHRNKGIADKEINFTACCLELMTLIEVEINFRNK